MKFTTQKTRQSPETSVTVKHYRIRHEFIDGISTYLLYAEIPDIPVIITKINDIPIEEYDKDEMYQIIRS